MSSDKVVSINPGVSIDANGQAPVVDPQFVELIETLPEKVKSGEVTSIYATGFDREGTAYRLAYSWESPYQAVGIIEAMKQHLLNIEKRQGE